MAVRTILLTVKTNNKKIIQYFSDYKFPFEKLFKLFLHLQKLLGAPIEGNDEGNRYNNYNIDHVYTTNQKKHAELRVATIQY